jgi:hypothetical protein
MDHSNEAVTPATLPGILSVRRSKDYELAALPFTDAVTEPELAKPRSRLRLFAVLTGLNVSSFMSA